MPESISYAVVLTGPAAVSALDAAVVAAAIRALDPATILEAGALADGVAWQALIRPLPAGALDELRARLAAAVAPRPIDVNIVAGDSHQRRKRLLVADMESTIIEQECLDELARYAGCSDRIAAITASAMRGERAFEAALEERVALIGGLDAKVLDTIYDAVTLMPGAETLVATMRRHGAYCALVTGGFSTFSERIADRLGFDSQQANTLEISDGKLAGKVRPPILGREAKLDALNRLRRQLNLERGETLAVGDGANDLAMIAAAGLGVAYRAKPIVAAAAPVRIDHGDLSALLYLQGYRRAEFA